MISLFLIAFTVQNAFELILKWRHFRSTHNISNLHTLLKRELGEKNAIKAGAYCRAHLKADMVELIFDVGLVLGLLFSGVLPWLDTSIRGVLHSEVWIGATFLFCVFFLQGLVKIPFSIYSTFVLENNFGFNRTTPGLFVSDLIKNFMLSIILGIPFLAGLLWIIHQFPQNWWWMAFLVTLGYQLILFLIYPIWLAPLFNKFKPLENGELKEQLTQLCQRLGFPFKELFVVDGSKRSAHANAYFSGFGKARRIVLYDTLIESLNSAQLEAVLAHEIGHWHHKHLPKMLIVSSISMLLSFLVLFFFLNWSHPFEAFGFSSPAIHTGFLLASFLFSPVLYFFSPLRNRQSRTFEYQADAFAVNHTNADSMSSSLLKIAKENLAHPSPDWLYTLFHASHPSLQERLDGITKEAEKTAT